jgi:hypothetical protein
MQAGRRRVWITAILNRPLGASKAWNSLLVAILIYLLCTVKEMIDSFTHVSDRSSKLSQQRHLLCKTMGA